MPSEKRNKYTLVLALAVVAVVYFTIHLTGEFRTIYNDAVRLKNWAASVRSLEACAIAQKTRGSAMFIECNAAEREADMWPVWRALELTIVHFFGDVTGVNAVSGLPGMGPDGAIRASIVSAFGWIVHSAALVVPLVVVLIIYSAVTGNVPTPIRAFLMRARKAKVDEPEVDVPLPKPEIVVQNHPWRHVGSDGHSVPSGYWPTQQNEA